MCLRMVGKSGSNVIGQETPSAKVDEMCKKLQASHSDKISFHLESCLVGSLEPVCACISTHTHVSLFLNTLSHNALPSSFPFNFLAKSLTTFALAWKPNLTRQKKPFEGHKRNAFTVLVDSHKDQKICVSARGVHKWKERKSNYKKKQKAVKANLRGRKEI